MLTLDPRACEPLCENGRAGEEYDHQCSHHLEMLRQHHFHTKLCLRGITLTCEKTLQPTARVSVEQEGG